jgi:hypothetical protein
MLYNLINKNEILHNYNYDYFNKLLEKYNQNIKMNLTINVDFTFVKLNIRTRPEYLRIFHKNNRLYIDKYDIKTKSNSAIVQFKYTEDIIIDVNITYSDVMPIKKINRLYKKKYC